MPGRVVRPILNVVNAESTAPIAGGDGRPPGEAGVEACIEQVARYFEEAGLPRVAGRLIGALVVADPREQSAAELAHRVRASRGSMSTMGRLLVAAGLAERRTQPGDRRELVHLMAFFEREWPPLVERWHAERAAAKGMSGG